MKTVGIIAEFNPFHNGHQHIINTVRQEDNRIVCVIGDDFTQRGDVALISKYARAEAALNCGADLCVLMPVPWSMSCANNFAIGGISILKELGVDTVAFGSECGDIEKLKKVSEFAHSDDLSPIIAKELQGGTTFAKARQNALEHLIGEDALILANPNDTLATEYIYAAQKLNFHPEFICIKREGCAHDSTFTCGEFASASAIREAVCSNNTEAIAPFMPKTSFEILTREKANGNCADIRRLETAILAKLRLLTAEDFKVIPEVSEGLENKIVSAIANASTLLEAAELIKSKRYTLARIRRILMAAFLGIDTSFFGKPVPYIKVLGFNKDGEQIIRDASPDVPFINRSRDYLDLEGDAEKCFKLQNDAANLYALACESVKRSGRELSEKIIKI